uniref:ABC transporter subunit PenL n=1 Tax=Pediococcus pentosaceus TaxID=1255 RepID=Q9WVZ4_PEDPE|nr:ABC transporter ATP-binding protein [Pediococcus pentosaceus]AAD25906.1 ABC transporter subunit PenL [Pediococcus pentosaceus]AAD39629.1 putative ABC transporter ATP-binding subunit [Pediococcus pentosaceus]
MEDIPLILTLSKVNKSISQKKVINDVSFSLEKGKILALLGPNGAGKTTIIRLITSLIEQDSGVISVFNGDINPSNIRQNISVQNDGNLYENLTIFENLKIWGGFYEIPEDHLEVKISELTSRFEISERLNSKVGELSKGMKQKVLIIRALLTNPKLLILDEPTSGLDPYMIDLLTKILTEYVKRHETTIIMATHQLLGLESIADDVLILNKGEVVVHGKTTQLISDCWPTVELDVLSDKENFENNLDYLTANFNVIHSSFDINITRIMLETKDNHSRVIADIANDIPVNGITIVNHTVKELYFKTLGVEQIYE